MSEEEQNCNICGDDVNINHKIILRCKHSYHYTCLVDALKSKLTINGKMKIGDRCCPYCRCRVPLLPYHEQCGNHIPGVHRALPVIIPTISPNQVSINVCSGVCKNGQPCKFKAKYNGYCGHHKQIV